MLHTLLDKPEIEIRNSLTTSTASKVDFHLLCLLSCLMVRRGSIRFPTSA